MLQAPMRMTTDPRVTQEELATALLRTSLSMRHGHLSFLPLVSPPPYLE